MNLFQKINFLYNNFYVKSFFVHIIVLLLTFEIFDKFYLELKGIILFFLFLILYIILILILYKVRIMVLFFTIILLFTKIFIMDIQIVNGKSMEPTIKNGSLVIIDRIHYGIPIPSIFRYMFSLPYKFCIKRNCYKENLSYFDIIVFDFPDPVLKNRRWIKRIIAKENDIFLFKDHQLFVNGKPVNFYKEIDYLPYEHSTLIFSLHNELKYYSPALQYYFLNGIGRNGVVPKNSYLVIGDNAKESRDSRIYGFIPDDRIIGKVIYVFQ